MEILGEGSVRVQWLICYEVNDPCCDTGSIQEWKTLGISKASLFPGILPKSDVQRVEAIQVSINL